MPHKEHHHSKHHMGHHDRGHDTHSIKHTNPDKGPPMMEGKHHFDKGYLSDDEMSHGAYPEAHERGNEYLKMTDEIQRRDAKKLRSDKFSKIA